MSKKQHGNITGLSTQSRHVRKAALSEYIALAREQAHTLGFPWEQPNWKGVGYFAKTEAISEGRLALSALVEGVCLDPMFIDFAKAYIVNQHMLNPNESRSQHLQRLSTLRFLESTLLRLRGCADPLELDSGVFDAAASRVRDSKAARTANKVGFETATLARVLASKGILPAICAEWTNPNKAPKNISTEVTPESQRAREMRLPNADALFVIADIFNRDLDVTEASHHKDIYITSALALMMCAPSRGQEIHRLPSNLEFRATDKFGVDQLGLRLEASKGFGLLPVSWTPC